MNDADELKRTLARLRDVLGQSGEAHWAGLVARALAEPDDSTRANLVRSWFAGTHGLHRLVLSPARGHAVQSCAIDSTNRALAALRAEAKRLAEAGQA